MVESGNLVENENLFSMFYFKILNGWEVNVVFIGFIFYIIWEKRIRKIFYNKEKFWSILVFMEIGRIGWWEFLVIR